MECELRKPKKKKFEEDSSSFHEVYSDYDQRMPLMVSELVNINNERIANFKTSMQKYVEAKSHQLQMEMMALSELNLAVEEIDPEKENQLSIEDNDMSLNLADALAMDSKEVFF